MTLPLGGITGDKNLQPWPLQLLSTVGKAIFKFYQHLVVTVVLPTDSLNIRVHTYSYSMMCFIVTHQIHYLSNARPPLNKAGWHLWVKSIHRVSIINHLQQNTTGHRPSSERRFWPNLPYFSEGWLYLKFFLSLSYCWPCLVWALSHLLRYALYEYLFIYNFKHFSTSPDLMPRAFFTSQP